MSSENTGNLPERPKDGEGAAEQAATGPSKKDLKKAAKEAEKAKKAEERAAKEAAEKAKRQAEAEANDNSKGLYGPLKNGLDSRSLVKLKDLDSSHVGKVVTVQTYVYNARIQSSKLAFLDLRDGIENIQAVIAEAQEPPVSRLMVKFCGSLNKESIVRVEAKVEEPKEPVNSATISHLELHIMSCFTVAVAPMKLEIQLKDAMNPPRGEEDDDSGEPNVSLKTRLDNRILDLRVPINQAIFSINGQVGALFREYMTRNGFREIWTPKMIGAATEGGGSVFEMKYFEKKGYLTQSPQFFKQMAISGGFERVFEIGPVFRAEKSFTHRHLTEFTGLDFEMTIYNKWEEVLDQVEGLVLHIFRGLRERCKKEMEVIQRSYPDAGNFKIPDGQAPRIRFPDGIQMLRDAGVTDISEDDDIDTVNEKKLGALVREKHGTDFYFLTHYPIAARPFYTHLDPENAKLTLSYDAFMRGQEIVSGAQRVHEADVLEERMRSKGVDPKDEGFRDYIESFRRACPPHGGAGFGLNRITMLWLGLPDIRQATMFPRDPGRLAP